MDYLLKLAEKLMTDIANLFLDYKSDSIPNFISDHYIFCIIVLLIIIKTFFGRNLTKFSPKSVKGMSGTANKVEVERKRPNRDYRI